MKKRKFETKTCAECGVARAKRLANMKPAVSNTRLYTVWEHMKGKCQNPNDKCYQNHGGRGIAVCGEWQNFSAFQTWALENGYTDELFLDRIDDTADFCSGNCRWASKKELDEKRFGFVEIDGVRRTFKGWSRLTGIPLSTLRNRWRVGDAGQDLIRPVGQPKENKQTPANTWSPRVNIPLDGGSRNTHRGSYSRLYGVWQRMKYRCDNSHCTNYKDYGGRGIKVCDEWKSNFQAFQAWAMENGYDETAPLGGCTIDRIDNNKGYSPENCRWISIKAQANNRRNNILVEIDGETMTLSGWAKRTGISRVTLNGRYHRGDRGHDLIRPVAN